MCGTATLGGDFVATATERIPILVSKADKEKFVRKAKSHGLSISEFACAAMDSFEGSSQHDEAAMDRILEQLQQGTLEAGRSLDAALQFCAESNDRLARLEAWMHAQGYRR
jgi:hypothetical protein